MLTHKGTQTIETPRLILRKAVVEDAEPMFRNWATDPEVTKFLTWPPHESIEVTQRVVAGWVTEYEKDDYYHWMIVLKEIGEPIGSLLVSTVGRAQSAHAGYCIGKRWWHQGICDADYYAILRSDWKSPKHFMESFAADSDTALVQEIYRRKDETERLNKSQAAKVEFLTTVRYIEKYLTPGAKILDVGAGAGEYSIYFARKGYPVSALELADANIAAFREKITSEDPIDLVQGNALDLSHYDNDSFDVVLLFGPLYHLHEEADKLRCIEEAKRVCKPDGKIFFAFISNDMVILTMQQAHSDYLLSGDYNKETFRLDDFPFVFHTVDRCRELLTKAGINICHEVAADGASELLKELINRLDPHSFEQYLRFHDYICEKPEFLGMSNHLLFIGTPEK